MAKESQREVFAAEDVTVACDCGRAHLLKGVHHYDRVILKCGKPMWALRPKRFGPLQMFPWPGPNLTRQELAEQQNEEWNNARLSA